jgi:hypothetical protein
MLCRAAVVVTLLAAAVAALSASGGSEPGAGEAAAATTAAAAAPVPRWKVWLCRPGQKPNWCNVDLDVTEIAADGTRTVVRAPAPRRPIDCFFVYPTVSQEQSGNSDLVIGNEEQGVVIIEAAHFGQACRLYAPLYRQTTSFSNVYGGGDRRKAYRDVRAAWRDYLAHYNGGRGVVLLGHSQGTGHLAQLIREEIENDPAARKLLVSAILLGGGVTEGTGPKPGGSFARLEPCTKAAQSGCVVAYGTWNKTPPGDEAGGWIRGSAERMLCVNPAAPGGGSAPITPVFPWFAPQGIITQGLRPEVKTLWVSFPGKYTARCVRSGTRSWLLVEDRGVAGDRREGAKAIFGEDRGLHAADVNIALRELVALVRAQGAAWAAGR